MKQLLLGEEVYRIVGAAMEVYNQLGHGFLEAVYQEALQIELELRDIPFQPQPEVAIHYKGRELKKHYLPDLMVFGQVVVELKALDALSGVEEAQLLNYLRGTGFQVGVLLNFGSPNGLDWKRMVWTAHR